MASLETKMDFVIERLAHQDACVDALKRQVWLATGALGLLMVLVNLSIKFVH